jgi:hypothetical protein
VHSYPGRNICADPTIRYHLGIPDAGFWEYRYTVWIGVVTQQMQGSSHTTCRTPIPTQTSLYSGHQKPCVTGSGKDMQSYWLRKCPFARSCPECHAISLAMAYANGG